METWRSTKAHLYNHSAFGAESMEIQMDAEPDVLRRDETIKRLDIVIPPY